MKTLDEYIPEVRDTVANYIDYRILVQNLKTPEEVLKKVIELVETPPIHELTLEEWAVLLGVVKVGYEKFVETPYFWSALLLRLREDEKSWGDTWRKRPIAGQTSRTLARFRDYHDKLVNRNPDPAEMLLKAAGNAHISIVRLLHPDYEIKKEG